MNSMKDSKPMQRAWSRKLKPDPSYKKSYEPKPYSKPSIMKKAPEKVKIKDDTKDNLPDHGPPMVFRPLIKYRTLSYDFLAPSSLLATESHPLIQGHKSNGYLVRWWCVAKKWDLLSDELREIDSKYQAIIAEAKTPHIHAESSSTLPANEGDIQPPEDVAPEDDNDDVVGSVDGDDVVQDDIESASIQVDYETEHSTDYDDEEDIQVFPGDEELSSSNDANTTTSSFLHAFNLTINYDATVDPDCSDAVPRHNAARINQTTHVQVSYEDVPFNMLRELCNQHHARVLCISDVHGCIDELLDLLRIAKYRPGDVVLFLGDLVAKGPYSVEVIELAMDLNALCVRGNHEQDVINNCIRIANKENVNNITNEHYRIASKLNSKQVNWLIRTPYYIQSPDLGSVFVHAGFQLNTALNDQDGWVMMTMRSMLPDGKPSPRCFYKHPWADKWTGPMTAIFGHDAARGLQVYENAIGLDTGCVYGGNLTALILPEREVIGVKARRVYQDFGDSISHRMYNWSKDNEHVSISRSSNDTAVIIENSTPLAPVRGNATTGKYLCATKPCQMLA